MRFLDCAGNTLDRAGPGASRTANALVGDNGELEQALADPGRALFVDHMGLVFVVEMVDCTQYGVRRGLAEAAQRGVLNNLAQLLKLFQIIHFCFAFCDPGENFIKTLVADPAGRALAARFIHRELEVEAGDINHAISFIKHDHAAGAHHRAGFDQVVVIYRCIQHRARQTAARRAAGLHSFELMAVTDTAADIEDNLAQGCAHRHFNQTNIVDLAGERENFGTMAFFCAN